MSVPNWTESSKTIRVDEGSPVTSGQSLPRSGDDYQLAVSQATAIVKQAEAAIGQCKIGTFSASDALYREELVTETISSMTSSPALPLPREMWTGQSQGSIWRRRN